MLQVPSEKWNIFLMDILFVIWNAYGKRNQSTPQLWKPDAGSAAAIWIASLRWLSDISRISLVIIMNYLVYGKWHAVFCRRIPWNTEFKIVFVAFVKCNLSSNFLKLSRSWRESQKSVRQLRVIREVKHDVYGKRQTANGKNNSDFAHFLFST